MFVRFVESLARLCHTTRGLHNHSTVRPHPAPARLENENSLEFAIDAFVTRARADRCVSHPPARRDDE